MHLNILEGDFDYSGGASKESSRTLSKRYFLAKLITLLRLRSTPESYFSLWKVGQKAATKGKTCYGENWSLQILWSRRITANDAFDKESNNVKKNRTIAL